MRFLCYDEPFSGLDILPNQNSRSSYGEFIEILKFEPAKFWSMYSPIEPLNELDSQFTHEQKLYLNYLINKDDNIVIDETHLHMHIHSLAELLPEAYVIHLHRRASSFAASHLNPSLSVKNVSYIRKIARYIRYFYNKKIFWTRKDFIPGLRRNELIGNSTYSKFALMLRDAGYDVEEIMSSPTLVKLLSYWHHHFHYLSEYGPDVFGERYMQLSYEDFAHDPDVVMQKIYEWVGMEKPNEINYSNVYSPKPPYRDGDPRWKQAAKTAGFSDNEILTLL